MSDVRTRVAPSPTGDPHVGTAYVALVNMLFARKHGGSFVLRIEDTDRERSSAASERTILAALRWLGIAWNEGPDVGGPYGPYRQSDRGAIYAEHAEMLLAGGHAFRCYCSAERLEAMRAEQRALKVAPRYDGRCSALSEDERAAYARDEASFTVRLRVPQDGVCTVDDLRRGPIEIAWSSVDMQVLVKSDGMPTYHLANVVDDHLMRITHVIRGEEWVSSAPKHLLLYDYFGWQPPKIAHLPLLRNPDKTKLSKRKNPTGILFYERMGYLPEALRNFLGLLATSSIEGEELMDDAALVERFGLEHVSLGGPVFDLAKLDWLNGRYLRELDVATFAARAEAWIGGAERLRRIAAIAQPRVERLSDLGGLLAFFFMGRLPIDAAMLRDGKLDDGTLRRALAIAIRRFDALADWTLPAIEETLRTVAAILDRKPREVMRVFFVAISGSAASVPLFEAVELLGRDVVRERLRRALELLGPVSAKEEKLWLALEEAR